MSRISIIKKRLHFITHLTNNESVHGHSRNKSLVRRAAHGKCITTQICLFVIMNPVIAGLLSGSSGKFAYDLRPWDVEQYLAISSNTCGDHSLENSPSVVNGIHSSL